MVDNILLQQHKITQKCISMRNNTKSHQFIDAVQQRDRKPFVQYSIKAIVRASSTVYMPHTEALPSFSMLHTEKQKSMVPKITCTMYQIEKQYRSRITISKVQTIDSSNTCRNFQQSYYYFITESRSNSLHVQFALGCCLFQLLNVTR